jgi:hypothetical protein
MSITTPSIEKLEREGWTRQFTASEPRLSEAIALYEEMGFEVHLEPVTVVKPCGDMSGKDGHCTACFEGVEDQHKIIFTRKKQDSDSL